MQINIVLPPSKLFWTGREAIQTNESHKELSVLQRGLR